MPVIRRYRLQPFAADVLARQLSFSGALTRTPGILSIEFQVQGAVELIRQGSKLPAAIRGDELWRHTCFELFFGIKGKTGYWEANFCPGGRWNVYRFAGYRTGMREDGDIGPPHCCLVAGPDLLSLTCTLVLNSIIDDSADLEAGVCSIIEATDGGISHWAIEHHGPQPDFHHRHGFLLELPGAKKEHTRRIG